MSIILTDPFQGKFRRYMYKLEKELRQEVTKHFKEIFGDNVILFRKSTTLKIDLPGLSSGSIPDDFALDLSTSNPRLLLIEYELAIHDIYSHISNQILRFKDSLRLNKQKIYNALKDCCANDSERVKLHNAIWENEPIILIVIDEITEEVKGIAESHDVKMLEFHTYVKESLAKEHLHIFDEYKSEKALGQVIVDVESHINGRVRSPETEKIFRNILQKIEEIAPNIRRIIGKTVISYRTQKNFASVELKKSIVRIHLYYWKEIPKDRSIFSYIREKDKHCHIDIKEENEVDGAMQHIKLRHTRIL